MRSFILSGSEGEKDFKKNLPSHLNAEEKDIAWNIVTANNESLNRHIENVLDEISAMGSGAVAGFAGGFGPPNRTNPWKRSTTRKPKVKKAKRSRRR